MGYRVRSGRGTQFRQWATTRLSELLVEGVTANDERVKERRLVQRQALKELTELSRELGLY